MITIDGGTGKIMHNGVNVAAAPMVDQWYLTSDMTSNGDITSLSRVSSSGSASPLATGMSASSGVFTFPSTGKYLVMVQATFNFAGSDNIYLSTQVSTNGGSGFTIVNYAGDANEVDSSTLGGGASSNTFVDVTDVSQVKVKFSVISIGTGSTLVSDSSLTRTGFTFIRMGDT